MGTKAALVAAVAAGLSGTVVHPLPAMANPATCYSVEECRRYVGKRLWVAIPSGNPNVVEATLTRGDWTTARTLKLRTGASFQVTGLSSSIGSPDFEVRLNDGRRAWVGSKIFLYTYDPIARAKAAAEECERRGPPRIGMTANELIESCWRKPRRIVKKTTAAGVEESYIYGAGHVVRLVDGRVAEIVEAR